MPFALRPVPMPLEALAISLASTKKRVCPTAMPTLVRLLTTLLVIAGILYGIMAALVYFVEPTRRETIVEIPLPPRKAESAPAQPLRPVPPADADGRIGSDAEAATPPVGAVAQ